MNNIIHIAVTVMIRQGLIGTRKEGRGLDAYKDDRGLLVYV